MQIFLTGATGYIGSAIAEQLQQAGYNVLGLARSDSAANQLGARGIEPLRGNLLDADSLVRGAKQADAVIHSGLSLEKGALPLSAQDYARSAAAEVDSVRTFINALSGTAKTLIVTSGMGVFGDTGTTVYAEDTPFQSPPQGASRRRIEIDVLDAKSLDIRTMIVRPPMVYGRGGSSVPNMLLRAGRKAGIGLYPGTGENAWSTVAVDDLAALYVRALQKGAGGMIFHATSGEPVPISAIAEAVSRNIGAGGAIRSCTQADAQQHFGLLAAGLTANLRVSSEISKRILGWQPTHSSILDDMAYGSYVGASA